MIKGIPFYHILSGNSLNYQAVEKGTPLTNCMQERNTMTREEIKNIFADATAEQIDSIMNIHGADINKAKKNVEKDGETIKSLTAELESAKAIITELENNKSDVEKLQATIDAYKQADVEREQKAKEAERVSALESRFNAVLGGREFAHEYIRNGVFNDFEKALQMETNVGKSDVEIFDSLTKDDKGVKQGLFASQNDGGMRGMGGIPNAEQAFLDSFYKNNPFYK